MPEQGSDLRQTEKDKGERDVDEEEEEVGEAEHKTQVGQRGQHSINISLADSAKAQGKRTLKEGHNSRHHHTFTLTLFPKQYEGRMHVANGNTCTTQRAEQTNSVRKVTRKKREKSTSNFRINELSSAMGVNHWVTTLTSRMQPPPPTLGTYAALHVGI